MFRDIDQSTVHDTSSVISAAHNKDYYKKNKLSGIYKDYDPITGDLIEQGEFSFGVQVGLWKVIDQDGHQQHFRYREQRVGARCQDGSYSSATGRGACSWHGGVSEWLYDNKRYQVGGTGKYQPIETRIQKTKDRLRNQFKIDTLKTDQQLFLEVANQLLKNNPNPELHQKQLQEQLTLKLTTLKIEYQDKFAEMQQIQTILQTQNLQLKQKNQQLQDKLAIHQKPAEKYEETVSKIKAEHQEELIQKDREIAELKKQLREARAKGERNKKQLDLSVSRSESENVEIKNQIKLIQQQLALLNQTVEVKGRKEVDENEYEEQADSENQQNIQNKPNLKQTSTPIEFKKQQNKQQQEKKPQPKIQTKPKLNKNKSKKIAQNSQPDPLQSLNTSQQSSIVLDRREQPSISDSLSYQKILNSKLFRDENNKSDLSVFVDIKPNKNSGNGKTLRDSQKTNEYGQDHKRMFRFKPDEQSSEEENQMALRTDSEEDKASNQDDNLEIFKSIPFKSGVTEGKEKEGKTVKEKK